MQRLCLGNNWLKTENIEAMFRKLPNLEDVNLSSAHLVTIPASLFQSNPRIKHFNVSDNYLISIQVGVFNHLHWIESLDLSSNYFMDLSEEFFSEVRRKSVLKMIYLQVLKMINKWFGHGMILNPIVLQILSNFTFFKPFITILEQSFCMRQMPHYSFKRVA